MIYFDNSATTNYKPDCVIGAVCNTMKHLSANPGRSSHTLSNRTGMLVYNTRKKLKNFFNAYSESKVIFTSNCTEALNFAILGTFVTGGHVVTTALEHNSVLRPLFELRRKNLISLTIVPPGAEGRITVKDIERAIRPDTYMVVTNHVSNVTGAIAPITEIGQICFKRGILYAVDSAQSAGYTDIDCNEQHIDYLAVAPHKGLHGPQGVGALLLSEKAVLRPIKYGGTGTQSLSTFQPSDFPESFECGTLPSPAIAGLNCALGYNIKHRAESSAKLTRLSLALLDGLKSNGNVKIYTPENTFNGIAAFSVKGLSSYEVSDILSDQYDVATRPGLHCAPLIHKHLNTAEEGLVRVSMSSENTLSEIEIFLSALKEISK